MTITDDEALAAFHECCRTEGIIPALESAHALAYAAKLAPTLPADRILLVNLSGRGDKDMNTVAERSGLQVLLPSRVRPADPRGRPEALTPRVRRHDRIDVRFECAARAAGRTALIPYVTAGDPSPDSPCRSCTRSSRAAPT